MASNTTATVTFRSADGDEFRQLLEVATGSGVVADLFGCETDMGLDATAEAVTFPAVFAREMRRVMEYLRGVSITPCTRIRRPLRSSDLAVAGVPPWAVSFIHAVPAADLTPLRLAASAMRVPMLEYLVCARIAAAALAAGPAGLDACFSDEPSPCCPETVREVKDANEYAWGLPDCDVCLQPPARDMPLPWDDGYYSDESEADY